MKDTIIKSLHGLACLVSGAAGSLAIGRIMDMGLDRSATNAVTEAQQKINEVEAGVKFLENHIKNNLNNSGLVNNVEPTKSVIEDNSKIINNKLASATDSNTQARDLLDKVLSSPSINDENKSHVQSIGDKLAEIDQQTSEVAKIIRKFIKGDGSNFNSIDFTEFYAYLDTLSISQELSLLNAFSLFFILITVLNILLALFGNIVVDYLNLETKYPKMATILKYRSKISKFSIMLDLFILIIACVALIYINLLFFIYS